MKSSKKTFFVMLAAMCLVATCVSAGCSKPDEAASDGKPGPAAGTPTPQGGVITAAPEHGKRPMMGAKGN